MQGVAEILMVILAWTRAIIELDWQRQQGVTDADLRRLEAEVTAKENVVLALCGESAEATLETVPLASRTEAASALHVVAEAVLAGDLASARKALTDLA